MASITFSGQLDQAMNEAAAEGNKILFIPQQTVGEVLPGAASELVVESDGSYSITLAYNTYSIYHYSDVTKKKTLIANSVVVSADTVVSTIPDLIGSTVPVTEDSVLTIQGYLTDAQDSATAAAESETNAAASEAAVTNRVAAYEVESTEYLISTFNGSNLEAGDVVRTLGYYSAGDGGGAEWVKTGDTGTASQSPVDTLSVSLTDVNGDYFELAVDGLINGLQLGVTTDSSFLSNSALIEVAVNERGCFLPTGTYNCYEPIVINTANRSIVGMGVNNTILNFYDHGFQIYKDDYLSGSTLNEATLRDFSMFRKGSDTTFWIGIDEKGTIGTYINNMTMYDFQYGHRKMGSKNSNHYRYRIFCGTVLSNELSGTYGISFDDLVLSDDTESLTYSNFFEQSFITSNNESMDYGIVMKNCDVIKFNNSYIARQAESALLTVQSGLTSTSSVTAISFSDTYFDGVKTDEDRSCCRIYGDSSLSISNFVFDNCQFGQYKNVFSVTNENIKGLIIKGQCFNITEQLGYFENTGDVSIDIDFYNINTDASELSNLVFRDCEKVAGSIDGDNASGDSLVKISGSCSELNLSKVCATNSTLDELLTLDVTPDKIYNTGCKIEFQTEVYFGGDNTGVTYSYNQGEYSINDSVMNLNIYTTLSSTGSLTGNVTMSLPVSANLSSAAVPCFIVSTGLTSDNVGVVGIVNNGANTLTVRRLNGSYMDTLSDVDVVSGSTFLLNLTTYV